MEPITLNSRHLSQKTRKQLKAGCRRFFPLSVRKRKEEWRFWMPPGLAEDAAFNAYVSATDAGKKLSQDLRDIIRYVRQRGGCTFYVTPNGPVVDGLATYGEGPQ